MPDLTTIETRVRGSSDDLIEFEGEVSGEICCYGTDERKHGALVVFSDGTVLDVQYGSKWSITVMRKGCLLVGVDPPCGDEYSDVAHFAHGLKWAKWAKEWNDVD